MSRWTWRGKKKGNRCGDLRIDREKCHLTGRKEQINRDKDEALQDSPNNKFIGDSLRPEMPRDRSGCRALLGPSPRVTPFIWSIYQIDKQINSSLFVFVFKIALHCLRSFAETCYWDKSPSIDARKTYGFKSTNGHNNNNNRKTRAFRKEHQKTTKVRLKRQPLTSIVRKSSVAVTFDKWIRNRYSLIKLVHLWGVPDKLALVYFWEVLCSCCPGKE